MRRWQVWSLGLLLLPRLSEAANLGPLIGLAPIGNGAVAAGFLFGGVGIVWGGAHVISAYRDRDMTGMGPVFGWIAATLVSALFLGTILPGLLAPVFAAAATL